MIFTPLRISIAALSLLLCTESSQASLILAFSTNSGASFTDTIHGDVGDAVHVDLFIRQTGAETRLATQGLVGFGTRAMLDNTTVSVRGIEVNQLLFGFDASTSLVRPSEFTMVGAASIGVDPKGADILLGSFNIDINSEGTTNLAFGDFDERVNRPDFALNDFPDFTEIDSLLFSNDPLNNAADRSRMYSLSVAGITAVPEPNLLGALGIALLSFSGYRHHRRHSATQNSRLE